MTFKLRPIFKNISLTFITQIIVFIGFLFIYRLIGKYFGPEGVGEYSLIKKVSTLLNAFLVLGLQIGIPRYIAISQNESQRGTYIKAGGLIVITLTLICLIFINLFKKYFAKIFFGSITYTNLILPLSLFLAGLILYDLVYFYFRGRLQVKIFNLLQIISFAVIPLTILLMFKNTTLDKLITFTGFTVFITACIFSLLFIKELLTPAVMSELKKSFIELIHYSLPRFIAEFIYTGLFALCPIFAAHITSIREVGYLSVSQSLLGVMKSGVTPLGLILLPKISTLIVQKREGEIKKNLDYLVGATIQSSFFLCVQLIIFTDVIFKYWLGAEFVNAVSISVMRIVFFSTIFYIFHGTMVSVLDAVKIKPINLINLFISFGLFLTVTCILLFLIKIFIPIVSLSISFTAGFTCLGILTYFSIRKIFPEKSKKDLNYLWITVGLNILFGSVSILAKSLIASKLYYLIIFEFILVLIYLLILWLLKMNWLTQVLGIVLLKTTSKNEIET